MPKVLQVEGDKLFRITVPDDAKITFAPFSPPSKVDGFARRPETAVGTLRIYQGTKDNIIAVFSGVRGFRDLSLEYQEKVATEEGATIWNSDQHGYSRETKVQRRSEWTDDEPALLEAPRPRRRKRAST